MVSVEELRTNRCRIFFDICIEFTVLLIVGYRELFLLVERNLFLDSSVTRFILYFSA
jgi:hypothetical protein